MVGYHVPLDCPHCGRHLAHVNGTASGSQALAVARCGPCGQEWVVTVTLRPVRSVEQEQARQRQERRRSRVTTLGDDGRVYDEVPA